jgi:hypothetical protein
MNNLTIISVLLVASVALLGFSQFGIGQSEDDGAARRCALMTVATDYRRGDGFDAVSSTEIDQATITHGGVPLLQAHPGVNLWDACREMQAVEWLSDAPTELAARQNIEAHYFAFGGARQHWFGQRAELNLSYYCGNLYASFWVIHLRRAGDDWVVDQIEHTGVS